MKTISELLDYHSAWEPNSGCLIWLGAVVRGGYGTIKIEGKRRVAHGIAYELHKGIVPAGLELDHLCRTPSCINPNHLEAVTHRENMLRGNTLAAHHAAQTHCLRGHELTEENTYLRVSRNGRYCRICGNARAKKYRAKRRVT